MIALFKSARPLTRREQDLIYIWIMITTSGAAMGFVAYLAYASVNAIQAVWHG